MEGWGNCESFSGAGARVCSIKTIDGCDWSTIKAVSQKTECQAKGLRSPCPASPHGQCGALDNILSRGMPGE